MRLLNIMNNQIIRINSGILFTFRSIYTMIITVNSPQFFKIILIYILKTKTYMNESARIVKIIDSL